MMAEVYNNEANDMEKIYASGQLWDVEDLSAFYKLNKEHVQTFKDSCHSKYSRLFSKGMVDNSGKVK